MKKINFQLIVLSFFFLMASSTLTLHAQSTLSSIVRDTIVRLDKGIVKPFLLDGKPVSTEVMMWFMQDTPKAHQHMKTARMTENSSFIASTMGFTWLGVDVLLNSSGGGTKDWSLAKLGAATIGTGLLLKWFSTNQKKKAIRHYNDAVISAYKQKDMGLKLEGTANGVGLVWKW